MSQTFASGDPTVTSSESVASGTSGDHFMENYAEILFDLCESMLWNLEHSQIVFRSIFRKIHFRKKSEKYVRYERCWVLKVACEQLLNYCRHHFHQSTAEEQIELDARRSPYERMAQFETYFHRLSPEDRILLLLKDKHKIPISELAAALGISEDCIKVRRQQALRTLEDWLWNGN